MLEIIALVVLGKKIAGIAKNKGRPAWLFVIMLVGFWIGGEIIGAIVGLILMGPGMADDPFPLALMGCALVGAAIGAVIAFMIANATPAKETYDRYGDHDDYEFDRRGHRPDDDYQDPRWRREESGSQDPNLREGIEDRQDERWKDYQ